MVLLKLRCKLVTRRTTSTISVILSVVTVAIPSIPYVIVRMRMHNVMMTTDISSKDTISTEELLGSDQIVVYSNQRIKCGS